MEEVLGRPGHGRKVAAICNWLNKQYGRGEMVAWAKQDPARIELDMPGNIKKFFADYHSVFTRYGRVIYGLYAPDPDKDPDRQGTEECLKAFLDLMFLERGHQPLKGAEKDVRRIQAAYYSHMLPDCSAEEVASLLERRFEYTEADLSAPRGQVNWTEYAAVKLPRADFLSVPCRFPDLRDDRELKAAIHFTLRKQLAGLQSQRTAGVVALQLLKLCQELLERVRDVPALQPSPKTLSNWLRGNLNTAVFRQGIQAVEWTIDDRDLAGLGDLQGLPWLLPMDLFFEAWVETVVSRLASRTGGVIKTGRQRETITPLGWSPPYLGSQRYLLPDIILDQEKETIIFDAKYKNHWEELSREGWAMGRPGQGTARASPQRPAPGVSLLNYIYKQESSLLPGLPLPLTDLVFTAPATAPFPQSLGPRRLPSGRSYSYRGTNGAQPRGYLSCIGVGVKCLAEMLFYILRIRLNNVISI